MRLTTLLEFYLVELGQPNTDESLVNDKIKLQKPTIRIDDEQLNLIKFYFLLVIFIVTLFVSTRRLLIRHLSLMTAS